MSREAFKPAKIHAEPGPLPEAHALTLAEEQAAKGIESEMALNTMRALGQMEGLEFSATVADRARVEIYLEIKKNKGYRALTVKGEDGKPRRVADLDEFCQRFLKKSARRIQEMAANHHLLGADLYEQAERIGFRTQDYRTLKALPADDQEVIKQAMSPEADRDQVLDLLQEMAARHASEKAALTAQAKEAEETAEARDQVVKAKESKITQLEEANHKLKRRIETATPDEIGEQLRDEVSQFAFGAEAQILGNLRQGFAALEEHAQANGVTHENFMAGCLAQIEAALITVRAEFGVKDKPDADPVPGWVKDNRPADAIVEEALGDQLAAFRARMGSQQA